MSGLLRKIGAASVNLANKLQPAEGAVGENYGKLFLASKLRRVPALVEEDIAMIKSFRTAPQYTKGQLYYLGYLVFGSYSAYTIGKMYGRGDPFGYVVEE